MNKKTNKEVDCELRHIERGPKERAISERELACRLTNDEVVDIVKNEAAKLGDHFKGFVVDVEEVEPYNDDNGALRPGHCLLRVFADADAAAPLRSETFASRSVIVGLSHDDPTAAAPLYERGKEFVKLLEPIAGKAGVEFQYPQNFFTQPDAKPAQGETSKEVL